MIDNFEKSFKSNPDRQNGQKENLKRQLATLDGGWGGQ
jgi:uncharacterized protein YukE